MKEIYSVYFRNQQIIYIFSFKGELIANKEVFQFCIKHLSDPNFEGVVGVLEISFINKELKVENTLLLGNTPDFVKPKPKPKSKTFAFITEVFVN